MPMALAIWSWLSAQIRIFSLQGQNPIDLKEAEVLTKGRTLKINALDYVLSPYW
jgi:hypothetical protein